MILLVVASYVQLVATFLSPDMHGPQDVKNSIETNASNIEPSARLFKGRPLFMTATSKKSVAALNLNPFGDVIADLDLSTSVESVSTSSQNEVSDEVSNILRWLNIVNMTAPATNNSTPAASSGYLENRNPSILPHVPKSQLLHNVVSPDGWLAPAGRRARRQVAESAGPAAGAAPSGVQHALRQGDSGSFGYIFGVKRKVLSMMLQSLYSAQERLWPLEPIVRKYEHLTPYRMAFIFMKLDQLVYECHSIHMYLDREKRNVEMTMTRRLQLYSHLVRRNIDVTYLVDYITERVPRDQMTRMRQWLIRQEQEVLLAKKRDWDRTTKMYPSRPPKAVMNG